ncbi:MAG: outer membrane beta-barrel protein [Caulobacterales bacterium]
MAAGILFGFGAINAQAEEQPTGLRIHGFIGTSDVDSIPFDDGEGFSGEISFSDGASGGVSIGADLGNFVVEAEFAARSADLDQAYVDGTGYVVIPSSDAQVNAVMANGWWQIPVGSAFELYLGGGLGLAEVEVNIAGYSAESDAELAWQLGAGAAFNIGKGFSIGAGYRRFEVDDVDVATNDIFFEVAKVF